MFPCIQYTFYSSKNELVFKFESDFDNKLDLVVDNLWAEKAWDKNSGQENVLDILIYLF